MERTAVVNRMLQEAPENPRPTVQSGRELHQRVASSWFDADESEG